MKILWITKRFSSGADIIQNRFTRQPLLFTNLKGHKIDALCVDYKKRESKTVYSGKVRVIIKPLSLLGAYNFVTSVMSLVKNEKYDLIIATSDPVFGVLGYFLSKRFKIHLGYDVQDNYDVYKSYKIPFVKHLERKAIKHACFVTCASYVLAERVERLRKKGVYIIPNCVDLKLFRPMNKQDCRKRFGLPKKAKIICYSGGIGETDIKLLIKSVVLIRKKNPDIYLLLVGGSLKKIEKKQRCTTFLGQIRHKDVPFVLNASDVLVIPYKKTSFTKVMYAPLKLLEYMAVNKPIVCSDVGEMKKMLKDYADLIYEPGNLKDLIKKINLALKYKKVNYRRTLKDFECSKVGGRLRLVMEGKWNA